MKFQTAIIIGGGAFGTSIASVLALNFEQVIIKVRSQDVYDALKLGENRVYLPGIQLSPKIRPALSWDEVDQLVGAHAVELIVSGLPTGAIGPYSEGNYHRIVRYLQKKIPFVSLSKGIDPQSLKMPDELFFDFFSAFQNQFVFLSGPSYASEILEQQITFVSIAGRSKWALDRVFAMMNTNFFKTFPTYDVKGLLLGGALKNVLAIAGGILEGHGHNDNTRAALITTGIADMLRFGVVFNARPETFYGPSGMGDLILTITGSMSRNKWFGRELAKGRKASEILEGQRTVIEGYFSTAAAQKLSDLYQIKCKIFNGVYRVIYENRNPEEVIRELMDYSTRVRSIF